MPNFYEDSALQANANKIFAEEKKFPSRERVLRAAKSNERGKVSKNRKFGDFRYPVARIENDSDYLEIKVLEYQPPGFETSGTGQSLRVQTSSESIKNNEVILGHIFLPIPEAITDSNGVTWGEDSLNGLAAAGVGIGMELMSNGGSLEELKNTGSRANKTVQQLLSDGNTASAINSSLAAAAVNAIVPNANVQGTGVFTRQTGCLLYTSPSPRDS